MAGKHTAEITKSKERTKKNKGGANHRDNNGKVTNPTKSNHKEDSRKKKKKIVNGINDDDVVIVPDSASESQSRNQNLQGYQNREAASDSEDDDDDVQGNGEEVESFKMENSISRKEGDAKKNSKKKVKKNNNEAGPMYSFPMHRVSRMIKADDPDIRITQEAVFLINKASEKFLKLFTKEGYANSSLEKKKHVEYKHLSSVVCKKRRFDFLSDFVPEKVKAENALTETPPPPPPANP